MKKKEVRNALLKLEAGQKMADWIVRGFNMKLLGQVKITQQMKDEMLAENGRLDLPLAVGRGNDHHHLHGMLTTANKDACRTEGGLDCYFLNPVEKEKAAKLFGAAADGGGPNDPLIYTLQANWASFFNKTSLEPLAVISVYARVILRGTPYLVIRFDGYSHYEADAEYPAPTNMAADAVVEPPELTRAKLFACIPNLLGCVPGLIGLCA